MIYVQAYRPMPKSAYRLWRWRILHGYSQTHAAKLLKCTQPTIARWEKGMVAGAKNIERISKITEGYVALEHWSEK